MAADPGKKEIIDAIEDLAKVIEDTLEKVKAFENESVDDFVENKQGNLLPPLVKYAECFKALGVKTRQQLDTLVKQHFKDQDVQDVWNYLEESEVEWNKFLQGVDSKLEKWSKTKQAPAVGDLGPVDIPLVNARTNKQEEISAANCQVLVVSFGVREGALKWLEETRCPYDMLVDSERQLYGAFGLGRSLSKVWSTSALIYYAEQIRAGRELPKAYKHIEDDPNQMGGDFIIDKSGFMLLVHCSKIPTDRPEVDDILHLLQENQKAK